MNKKGFTLAEVVVSFSILSIVLASVIVFTITYRDKVKEEEIRTQLIDFKNTVTKIVYDDIISGKLEKIEICEGQAQCVNFVESDGTEHLLKTEEVSTGTDKGLYIVYNGMRYLLPDSDLNRLANPMCWFNNDFDLKNYDNIYRLKISFEHVGLNEQYEILIAID